MLTEQLKRAREFTHESISTIASKAGTSRSTLSDYEHGKKLPRVDTAERLAHALGMETVLLKSGPRKAGLDRAVIEGFTALRFEPEHAIRLAREHLPVIIDADVNAERLKLSWGTVKTRTQGTTVGNDDDDPLDVWRLNQLVESASQSLRNAVRGGAPRLVATAGGVVVAENSSLSPLHMALDFLVRAISIGADPTLTRHQASTVMVMHGYSWLYPRHQEVAEYRRALVACMRTGNGDALLRVLLSGAERLSGTN